MTEEEVLNIIKKEGLQRFFAISVREDNTDWKCPSCKSPVVITGERKYETLSEHVEYPNKESYPLRDAYQCSDENCITRKNDIFWDYMGDRYGLIKTFHENGERNWIDDDIYFINENDSPFGSNSRQQNVEIDKKGLKKETYLHPAFCLWFLQPFIEYNYKANTDGEVLKRTWKLKFLKKDDRGEYCYLFHPFWGTWSHLNWYKSKYIREYKKEGHLDILKEAFEPSFNDAWVYRWHNKYMKLRYWNLYNLVK